MSSVDIDGLRQEWVGTVFQEIDLVVDQDRMLEWAVTCGETDPRFIDPAHPDFQASTSFPTHINAARMLPDDFREIGSGRGIDGGKSIRVAPPDARRRPAPRARSRSATSTPRPDARGRWCSSSTG